MSHWDALLQERGKFLEKFLSTFADKVCVSDPHLASQIRLATPEQRSIGAQLILEAKDTDSLTRALEFFPEQPIWRGV